MNPYSKTYRDLHPIKLNVRKNTCWQDEPSADYPLGGSLEIPAEETHELIDEKIRFEISQGEMD